MRQVTKTQFAQYLENDDIVAGSIVDLDNWVLARRFSEKEWVYVVKT